VGLAPGECTIPYQPFWLFWPFCLLLGAVTSRLDPPSHAQCMESRRFEFPWSGEPKWTPYPPPPLTPIHISLPTLSKNTPSISPLSYTYIHSPPTLYPIQMPPFILYTGPAPLPPIFAFLIPIYSCFLCVFQFYFMYISIHIISSLEYIYLTAFLGCNKLPGKGKWIVEYCRNQGRKKWSKIHTAPLMHALDIPYSRYAVGRPCGSLQQPAINSRGAALPPGQIRHRESLIIE